MKTKRLLAMMLVMAMVATLFTAVFTPSVSAENYNFHESFCNVTTLGSEVNKPGSP